MFAWLAKAGIGAIISHLAGYIIAIGLSFYLGVLYSTSVDIKKVNRAIKEVHELRIEATDVEKRHATKKRVLNEALNAFKKDDKLHRKEIDALKRIRDRGCILSDEELQAHPYSRTLRDGFIGRVRP